MPPTEENSHKKITIYDIPSYRDLLNLSRKETPYTDPEKTTLHHCLHEFNRNDLADEFFDIIRRMPNPDNRHTILGMAKGGLNTCLHINIQGCETAATAFAIIATINLQTERNKKDLAAHYSPISHLTAINAANILYANAALNHGATIILNPALYSAKLLYEMTNHRWAAIIGDAVGQSIATRTGILHMPIHHIPNLKPQQEQGSQSTTINRAIIGVIIYDKQQDFDNFFIHMTSNNTWAQALKAEIQTALSTSTEQTKIDIFPFIYPVRAAINEMANLDRITTKAAQQGSPADTHVFYTYSQWKQKNTAFLNGKNAAEHASLFTTRIKEWHEAVDASLKAGRDTEILLADVQTMTEYMNATGLETESDQSWQKAEAVIEDIEDPIIETLQESRHPSPKSDHPYASISPHKIEDGTIIYAVITINNAQGKRLARYILWNTHTHHADQAIEAARKLLANWGTEKVHHYEPTPIAICACCNEILAFEYSASGGKTSEHVS